MKRVSRSFAVGRFLADWRGRGQRGAHFFSPPPLGVGRFLGDWGVRRKVAAIFLPSPLVGEGDRGKRGRVRGLSPRKEPLIRRGLRIAHAKHRRPIKERRPKAAYGHLLPQGEKEESHPRRGHAAATASVSQLTIKSVPPVGAAIGNRLWPAYCRSVRSPANSAAAMTNPNAAPSPIPIL